LHIDFSTHLCFKISPKSNISPYKTHNYSCNLFYLSINLSNHFKKAMFNACSQVQ
jgi:hypothetical protein